MTTFNVFESYERIQARPARLRRAGGSDTETRVDTRRHGETGTLDMLVDAITSMLR